MENENKKVVVLPSDQEANKMVNDYVENWAQMNPDLDRNYHWSAVSEGFYLLLNKLRGK